MAPYIKNSDWSNIIVIMTSMLLLWQKSGSFRAKIRRFYEKKIGDPAQGTPSTRKLIDRYLVDFGFEGVIWATVTKKKNIFPFDFQKTWKNRCKVGGVNFFLDLRALFTGGTNDQIEPLRLGPTSFDSNLELLWELQFLRQKIHIFE